MVRDASRAVRRAAWVGLLCGAAAGPAAAADYVVTRYDDPVPDACLATDCSLREAVIDADDDDSARILLSAGTYQLSLVGTGGISSLDGGFDVVGGHLEIAGLGAELTRIDGAGVGEAILRGTHSSLDLTLRGIQFQNSDQGGVMALDGATLIEDCAFVNNGAVSASPGLSASLASDSLTVRRSTSTGNSGDGLSVNSAVVVLENVTSTLNGGLELRIGGNGVGGNVSSCNHCTLVGDSAGEVRISLTTTAFSNSIVVGGCTYGASAAIDSAGGNIESAGNTCQFDDGSDHASVAVADLALGALAANGGSTRTIALGGASVALGAALDALCAGEDQRGVARESDCESGAFEETANPVPAPLFADGVEQGHPGAWSGIAP